MSTDRSRRATAWRALRSFASRAGGEPLVQFLLVASVLFGADRLIHRSEPRASGDSITISQGRVEHLAGSFHLLAGRSPSRAELQALVDDFIDEEIDYREAIAMGLDADDTIVRRRMRQKLEFLIEEADAVAEPSEEQLATWLKAHAADYRVPERIAFRHILASRDERGTRADADAAAFLKQLSSGADPEKLGDASMLPAALPPTTREGVAAQFGATFAANVFQHTDAGWFGPVSSPFGSHDVLILTREAPSDPSLADIRDKLRSDWIEARRLSKRDDFQARLRRRYEVRVDWPERYASLPAPTDIPRRKRPLDTLIGE